MLKMAYKNDALEKKSGVWVVYLFQKMLNLNWWPTSLWTTIDSPNRQKCRKKSRNRPGIYATGHLRSCGSLPGRIEKITQQFAAEKVWFVAVLRLVLLPQQHLCSHSPVWAPILGQKWHDLCSLYPTLPINSTFFHVTSFHALKWNETWKESVYRPKWVAEKNDKGTFRHYRRRNLKHVSDNGIKDWTNVLALMMSTLKGIKVLFKLNT